MKTRAAMAYQSLGSISMGAYELLTIDLNKFCAKRQLSTIPSQQAAKLR